MVVWLVGGMAPGEEAWESTIADSERAAVKLARDMPIHVGEALLGVISWITSLAIVQ